MSDNQINEIARQFETRRVAQMKKWAFLTEHIADNHTRGLVAQLLENQDASRHRVPLFQESDQLTTTLPTTVFPSQIAFPTIVQSFPALAANELVQTVAMPSPNATILYQRFLKSTGGAELTHDGSWAKTAEAGLPLRARMKLDTMRLDAEKHMINMEWSAELEEDARALGGIDIQSSMVSALRDELTGDFDWLVIRDLYAAAIMSAETGLVSGMTTNRGGAGNANFNTATIYSYETPKAAQERLLDAIVDLKVRIYNKCFKQADFIVGNAASIARIEKLETYAPDVVAGVRVGGATARVGKLQGQYDVYVSNAAPDDKLLMGVKRTGYIFGIYKALELTPMNYLNDSDEYIRGVRSRIARKVADAGYYATLTFTTS